MFGALKRGFRSTASLILVIRNDVGELQPKRILAASRGFLAAARLSCFYENQLNKIHSVKGKLAPNLFYLVIWGSEAKALKPPEAAKSLQFYEQESRAAATRKETARCRSCSFRF